MGRAKLFDTKHMQGQLRIGHGLCNCAAAAPARSFPQPPWAPTCCQPLPALLQLPALLDDCQCGRGAATHQVAYIYIYIYTYIQSPARRAPAWTGLHFQRGFAAESFSPITQSRYPGAASRQLSNFKFCTGHHFTKGKGNAPWVASVKAGTLAGPAVPASLGMGTVLGNACSPPAHSDDLNLVLP